MVLAYVIINVPLSKDRVFVLINLLKEFKDVFCLHIFLTYNWVIQHTICPCDTYNSNKDHHITHSIKIKKWPKKHYLRVYVNCNDFVIIIIILIINFWGVRIDSLHINKTNEPNQCNCKELQIWVIKIKSLPYNIDQLMMYLTTMFFSYCTIIL
jgi:hypothetical protein